MWVLMAAKDFDFEVQAPMVPSSYPAASPLALVGRVGPAVAVAFAVAVEASPAVHVTVPAPSLEPPAEPSALPRSEPAYWLQSWT